MDTPKVRFMSRTKAEHYTAKVPYVVISITSPGEKLVHLPDSDRLMGVLRLAFTDIEHEIAEYPPAQQTYLRLDKTEVFTEAQAQRILDFIKMSPLTQEIVVHCQAGVSRSAGVAVALRDALGYRLALKPCNPNRLVHRKLIRAAKGADAVFVVPPMFAHFPRCTKGEHAACQGWDRSALRSRPARCVCCEAGHTGRRLTPK